MWCFAFVYIHIYMPPMVSIMEFLSWGGGWKELLRWYNMLREVGSCLVDDLKTKHYGKLVMSIAF